MDIFENMAIVKKVIDDKSISVIVIGEEGEKILTASKFYIEGLKEIIEKEEIVMTNFNPETNEVIEEGEE
ncbi:hypothetical protein [Clostridium faecium]|uniref:Uncharacterized protein n=1 Tax=Clostridium faecium TaxID=2762223 RepID=A0ABR8YP65_9CLOT|nr:hypothetical protein [Clostridium faecium]MBD8045806.1 hypothetical protein [Clostridium faecium]